MKVGKNWYRCLAKWKKMRDVIRTIICCSYVLCLPALIAHPTCAGWQRLVEDPLGTICMERLTLALSPLSPLSTCTLQILLCWVLVPQPAWISFMVLNPNQIIYSMAQCGHFSTQRRGVERAVSSEMIMADNCYICTCWQQQSGYATSAPA